ncbi:hypothetical protein RI129_002554 [Pyrocoelia pectoralis]|uniref:Odorant receptor n=1 Tax=Pyrocoelia pectoralis TaxID=417401 RepID=A0AAN7ZMA2_9COLE
MMQSTGVWPEENSGVINKIKYIFSVTMCIGLVVTMSIEVAHHYKDFVKLSETLYIMITITGYLVKQISLTYNTKTFLKIIEFLRDPIFLSYPYELDHYMVKTVRQSTFIANMYRYIVGCCVVLFFVYPMVDHKSLPFPFPLELGVYRYFMYAFQIVALGIGAWNNSSIDTITTSLMGITAAQLDILYEKIIYIQNEAPESDDNEDKNVLKVLRQFVEHHNAIIHLIESVEEVFTVGLFAQFTCSIIVICNTVFYIIVIATINSQFIMLLNYIIILVIQLFMYCWYGNEIMLKSVQLGEACYKIDWYNRDKSVGQFLFIIMERSKRPLTVTTVKLSTLSLTAFKSLLQWSYSCLALLLKKYQEPNNEQKI